MKSGLYHPDEFRDNCGFGLVAHVEGKPSHELLLSAISSLTCMTHRGGIAADGVTGDGCALMYRSNCMALTTAPTAVPRGRRVALVRELDRFRVMVSAAWSRAAFI